MFAVPPECNSRPPLRNVDGRTLLRRPNETGNRARAAGAQRAPRLTETDNTPLLTAAYHAACRIPGFPNTSPVSQFTSSASMISMLSFAI